MSDLNVVIEPGQEQLQMTRVFNAPRELVFRAYTCLLYTSDAADE